MMTKQKRECFGNLLGKIEDLDTQMARLKGQLQELKRIITQECPPQTPAPPERASCDDPSKLTEDM